MNMRFRVKCNGETTSRWHRASSDAAAAMHQQAKRSVVQSLQSTQYVCTAQGKTDTNTNSCTGNSTKASATRCVAMSREQCIRIRIRIDHMQTHTHTLHWCNRPNGLPVAAEYGSIGNIITKEESLIRRATKCHTHRQTESESCLASINKPNGPVRQCLCIHVSQPDSISNGSTHSHVIISVVSTRRRALWTVHTVTRTQCVSTLHYTCTGVEFQSPSYDADKEMGYAQM